MSVDLIVLVAPSTREDAIERVEAILDDEDITSSDPGGYAQIRAAHAGSGLPQALPTFSECRNARAHSGPPLPHLCAWS